MSLLSDRQQKILNYIMTSVSEQDFPPTIREIGEAVGISSTSVVNYNLTKLEDLELLTRRKEVSRGLSLNWARLEQLGFAEHSANGDGQATNMFKVPVLGHIAAGEPIQVNPQERENAENWVELATGMFGSPDELFALRVQGDSMIDASVLDGDIVILRHQETADNGDMVAAWIDGDEETTLKYLYQDGTQVRLEPANPNYEPIIREANKVRINGKVVSVLRYLN